MRPLIYHPSSCGGGDANGDCLVNILDLARMSSRFGAECGDPNWDRPSNFNDDRVLNFLDLTITGGNFDRSCPTPWSGDPVVRGGESMTAKMNLSPSPLHLPPGGTGGLNLNVSGAAGLFGAEAHFTFDPGVIRVIDADPGQEGTQVALGDLLAPNFVAMNQANNVAGTVDIALTQLAPMLPCDGDGALATITFEAVATGTSPVGFGELILADSDGGEIPAQVYEGTVEISPAVYHYTYLPIVMR